MNNEGMETGVSDANIPIAEVCTTKADEMQWTKLLYWNESDKAMARSRE